MTREFAAVCTLTFTLITGGCARFVHENTADSFDAAFRAAPDSAAGVVMKCHYFYPGRDYLIFSWLGRALFGDEAWNVTLDDGVSDGPFFVNRDIAAITPDEVRAGPTTGPPPRPPWRVKSVKNSGGTPGFVGFDAAGRSYLVKLDQPDHPELGTAAEVIGARMLWLLGYHIPSIYLVVIDGTGDPRFDGRRATASPLLGDDSAPVAPVTVLGPWKFDHFRMRREIRALRLACAWINDTDRGDRNTLAVRAGGQVRCYQVDFNSSLGSWNGRPKEPWRGWRHEWDVERQLVGVATLGLLPHLPKDTPVFSPAVGLMDTLDWAHPRGWRSQTPNTAFDRMTPRDAAWMASRIALVSERQIRAAIEAAALTRTEDADAVYHMLVARRRRILAAYLPPGRPMTTATPGRGESPVAAPALTLESGRHDPS